jgi:hypothetical protein
MKFRSPLVKMRLEERGVAKVIPAINSSEYIPSCHELRGVIGFKVNTSHRYSSMLVIVSECKDTWVLRFIGVRLHK